MNDGRVEELIRQLVGHEDDGDESVIQNASQALVKIGEPAVPGLSVALGDKRNNEIVRSWIAETLGKIGDSSAVPALSTALGDRGNGIVRWGSAWALGEIGGASAVPALILALGDNDGQLRQDAATALVKIGGPAVPALVLALGDDAETVRSGAAQALEEIGEPAVPALIEVLGDGDENVRHNAAEKLGENGPGNRYDLNLLREAARKAGKEGRPTTGFVKVYNEWSEILNDRARKGTGAKNMRAPPGPRTPGDKQRRSTVRGAGI